MKIKRKMSIIQARNKLHKMFPEKYINAEASYKVYSPDNSVIEKSIYVSDIKHFISYTFEGCFEKLEKHIAENV